MALMSFLDTIPNGNENDWNTWDMQDLIDDTNAKTPERITPAMEAQLIKVELDFGEQCQHLSSVQGIFQAVLNTSVLDNIDSMIDSFPFSRAIKILRDHFEFVFERGTEVIHV
jgi:hypothetical protein